MTRKYNRLYTETEVDDFVSTEILGNNFKSKISEKHGFLTVIKLAGRDNQNKLSYFCLCDCGNYVLRSAANLRPSYKHMSCGCKYSEAFRNPLEKMKDSVLKNTDYEIVECTTLWESKWILNCKEHGLFQRRYASVKNGKYGCPDCASYGFNPKKITKFYVNSIWDNQGNVVSYKFGLTNQNVKLRMQQMKIKSNLIIHNELSFDLDGYIAWELERYIKITIPCNFLTKQQISNGFTETISPIQLVNLIDILNNIFKE